MCARVRVYIYIYSIDSGWESGEQRSCDFRPLWSVERAVSRFSDASVCVSTAAPCVYIVINVLAPREVSFPRRACYRYKEAGRSSAEIMEPRSLMTQR